MDKQSVATLVNRYLQGEHLDEITFVVDTANIPNDGAAGRVPVRPTHLPAKLFGLYEFLAEIEQEIAENEEPTILLLTGEALEEKESVPVGANR